MRFEEFAAEHGQKDSGEIAAAVGIAFLLLDEEVEGQMATGFLLLCDDTASEAIVQGGSAVGAGTVADAPKVRLGSVLHVLQPPDLSADRVLTLGRLGDSDIPLTARDVSKSHAVLRFRAADGVWQIGDRASTNGTFVNDDRLSEGKPVQLHGGEGLRFGSSLKATFHTAETIARSMKRVR